MKNKICFILLMLLSKQIFGADYQLCMQIAGKVNKQTPMQIDKETQLLNTICSPKNPVTFIYRYRFDYDLIERPDIVQGLKSLYTKQLNSWCTDLSVQTAFNLFPIEFSYEDKKGRYITSNKFQKSQCK